MTIREKIRQMNEEEFAKFILDVMYRDEFCKFPSEINCIKEGMTCPKCVEMWLKEEWIDNNE